MDQDDTVSDASGDGPAPERDPTAGLVPEWLGSVAAEFDRRFEAYLTPERDVPAGLAEAVRYSALAPGKRVRPYLVIRCCELVGGDRARAWPVAAAVECVHAFSLIHDDLPAMDDDDLRRGQPTCHRKFGEAAAILAGDALVVLAFELLARHIEDRRLAVVASRELAELIGWSGMIGGQAVDVEGEAKPPELQLVRYIHERKTAALFEASCRLGALIGGANRAKIDRLGRFGRSLGRAFQIADDLLDVTADEEAIGKKVGKDAHAGKQSFPRCVGIGESRSAAREAASSAIAELAPFGPGVADLTALVQYTVDRNY